MDYDNLIQTINQLNETIQILQRNVAKKDETIMALEQAINDRSNVTKSPTEISMVIVVPSSDEIDHHGGKVVKFKQFPYFTLAETQKIIAEDGSFEKTYRRRFEQKYEEEPRNPSSN